MSQKNLRVGQLNLPVDTSFYLEDQNHLNSESSQPTKQSRRAPGIHLLNKSPEPFRLVENVGTSPINRIAPGQPSPRVSSQPYQTSPYQPQCQCGRERVMEQLRLQNESLRKQLQVYEQSFQERVNLEVRQRQSQATRHFQRKIEGLQAQLNRQFSISQQEQNTKQHLKTYEKYIDNLERAKDSLAQELQRARKENERLAQLEDQILRLQQQKQQLSDSMHKQEDMFNQTVAQINLQSQHRNSGYYVEELQRTNSFLQKENKRLNSILLERLRMGTYA